jgi:hypothetical protein
VTITDLAGKPAWYPELDSLIEKCVAEFCGAYPAAEALRIVRDVFSGLARSDMAGNISTGDEHEWAAVAVRANELALKASYESAMKEIGGK